MNAKTLSPRSRGRVSRREFLGAAAGTGTLAVLNPSLALARGHATPSLLTDYIGRLCYNENPLGPSPAAQDAIVQSASLAHRYPDWFADSLRSDLASMHGVATGQTIAGCGATEILRLAALAFADPDGNVVCPYPSYSQFPSDAGFLGSTVNYSNLDANHRVDLDDIASRVNASTSAVCITNPNNPTATVLAASAIADFVDALPAQVVTIIDEAYHDYVHDPSYGTAIDLVRQGKKVVVIRTFSKVHGLAGTRIGYAVGPSSQISAMSSWHLFATVSRLGLEAARAALGDTQHTANTVALNDEAKDYCFSQFDSMGLAYIPSETNFFMVDVGTSAGTVASQLAARGIQVRTGWGMPQHLRVSTGRMEEMQDFITALIDILNPVSAGGTPAAPGTALWGNVPNPFTAATELSYSVQERRPVLIQVFNIRGQLIRTLRNRIESPGSHTLSWDGTDDRGVPVGPGSYFYRMNAGGFSETRRMILIR